MLTVRFRTTVPFQGIQVPTYPWSEDVLETMDLLTSFSNY